MLDSLPDDARVWSFAAAAPLAPAAREALLAEVDAFLPTWTSHGRPVPAAATLLHERILVVAAHLGEGDNAGVSGCGIDSMQRAVDEAARRAGIEWLDTLAVIARGDDALLALSRGAFRHGVRQGAITPQTLVYDATVETLGALRQRGLLRPAAETWHARAFRLSPA